MANTTTDEDEAAAELREAFQMLDIGDRGHISATELGRVMSKLGVDLTEEEISGMIKEADFDGDGFINYDGEV